MERDQRRHTFATGKFNRSATSSKPSCSAYRIMTIERSSSGSSASAAINIADCSLSDAAADGDPNRPWVLSKLSDRCEPTLRRSATTCRRKPSTKRACRIRNSHALSSPCELPRKASNPWLAVSIVSWTKSEPETRARSFPETCRRANWSSSGRKPSSKPPNPEAQPDLARVNRSLNCMSSFDADIWDLARLGSSSKVVTALRQLNSRQSSNPPGAVKIFSLFFKKC